MTRIFSPEERRCLWRHADITRQTVYNWDTGKAMPTGKKLIIASKTLGISCRTLLARFGKLMDEKERTMEVLRAASEMPVPTGGEEGGVPNSP